MNGKVGIDKKNDCGYFLMLQENFATIVVLLIIRTHACNKTFTSINNTTSENGNLHRTLLKDKYYNVCINIDCMPCKITVMSTCFNLPIASNETHPFMRNNQKETETPSPINISKDKPPTSRKVKSAPKLQWMDKDVKKEVEQVNVFD